MAWKTKVKNIDTPEVFFKSAMQLRYNTVNEWQLERCLALYYKEGTIPDFVQITMRQLYGAFTSKEIS